MTTPITPSELSQEIQNLQALDSSDSNIVSDFSGYVDQYTTQYDEWQQDSGNLTSLQDTLKSQQASYNQCTDDACRATWQAKIDVTTSQITTLQQKIATETDSLNTLASKIENCYSSAVQALQASGNTQAATDLTSVLQQIVKSNQKRRRAAAQAADQLASITLCQQLANSQTLANILMASLQTAMKNSTAESIDNFISALKTVAEDSSTTSTQKALIQGLITALQSAGTTESQIDFLGTILDSYQSSQDQQSSSNSSLNINTLTQQNQPIVYNTIQTNSSDSTGSQTTK